NLEIRIRPGTNRKPTGNAVVVCKIRRTNSFTIGFKDAINFGLGAVGRFRARSAVFDFAEDSLLSRRLDAVGQGAYTDNRRDLERRTTVKVTHKTKGAEWSDKERSIRN